MKSHTEQQFLDCIKNNSNKNVTVTFIIQFSSGHFNSEIIIIEIKNKGKITTVMKKFWMQVSKWFYYLNQSEHTHEESGNGFVIYILIYCRSWALWHLFTWCRGHFSLKYKFRLRTSTSTLVALSNLCNKTAKHLDELCGCCFSSDHFGILYHTAIYVGFVLQALKVIKKYISAWSKVVLVTLDCSSYLPLQC